ncbi:hypothetical protein AX15_004346 [Amanita polypyramis BW_CC]|nr:hypothetical protein AX15_004346 [Amanita polypyramis BW_CC]
MIGRRGNKQLVSSLKQRYIILWIIWDTGLMHSAVLTVHYNRIFEILYYRYGFVLQESDPVDESQVASDSQGNADTLNSLSADIEKQWRVLTKLVASSMAAMPGVVKPVQLAVSFINTFIEKGCTPSLEIYSMWDLSTECDYPLHGIMGKSQLQVMRQSNDKAIHYVISPKKDNSRHFWTLIIRDPITVLEIMRRNLNPKIESVVNFLTHSGIPFNTVMPSNTYPPPPRSILSPPVSLGVRLRSFIPDPMEYRLYEAARDDFLRGPFGRAALLKGGIIWRLAKGTVPIHEVFNGPTRLAKDFGQLVLVSNGQDMIDDNLSDDQSELISGLYQIGKSSTLSKEYIIECRAAHGNQIKEVSWWPKHTTWKGCGLDVGYWSSSCETWFLNRLRAIRNGTATPRTSREWKNSLSYLRRTPVLVENGRRAADMFLSGHTFPGS